LSAEEKPRIREWQRKRAVPTPAEIKAEIERSRIDHRIPEGATEVPPAVPPSSRPQEGLGTSVVERLKRKFGLGENPKQRMQLYTQLQVLYDRYPERMHILISTAVAEAVDKRRPDRYFCVAIKAKIREAGLVPPSINDARW
jgi:hypothetical protein